jgi:murein L,D-transpeptidase YafK
MVIRIFKQESALEVWKRTGSGQFRLFKTYEICAWSGELGPKIAEGDRQAPEGFYTITPGADEPALELLTWRSTPAFPTSSTAPWGAPART